MSHLQEQFEAFHRDNPQVWVEFEKLALALVARGRTHYSSDALLHVLRFNRAISTTGAGEVDGRPLKLNNNYSALYARLFHQRHPELENFFHTRHSKADGEIVGSAPCHDREVNA